MPTKNTNTNNNKNNIKINIDLGDKVHSRKKAKRRPPPPPAPPVQNVNVFPLNSTMIPGNGLGIPEYFTTAITNQTMSMAAMANAMQRMVNNDYENAAMAAGDALGGGAQAAPQPPQAVPPEPAAPEPAAPEPAAPEAAAPEAAAPEAAAPAAPAAPEAPAMNLNPLFDENVEMQDAAQPPANPRVRRREDGGYGRDADVLEDLFVQYRQSAPRSNERVRAMMGIREGAARLGIDVRNPDGGFKTASRLRSEMMAVLRNRR